METKTRDNFIEKTEDRPTWSSGSPCSHANRVEEITEESLNGSHRKPVASVRPVVSTPNSLSQPVALFEPLLDLHEASAILGMHWKTLEAKARGREVPAFKVGKRWRFRLSSLNSWLENRINSNTTDHADVTRQERCS